MKLDAIRRAIRDLPTAEQRKLRERLGWAPDAGDVIIEVHDWKGPDRKWPRAVVIRVDRSREEIDILASVKQNAASVGHPAVMCAIKRWEEIIICQSALPITGNIHISDDDAEYFAEESERQKAERLRSGLSRAEYDRARLVRSYQDFHERTGRHINCARIASGHLRNLSKSLIEGANSRAWSKEQAFDVYRHKVFGASYSYLELAFQVWCGSRERSIAKLMLTVIERFRVYGFGAKRLGSPLTEDVTERALLGFDDVKAFLRSGPGKRALNGRRQLKAWKRAFDAWRFPTLTPHTQSIYLQKAKASPILTQVSLSSISPKLNWYQLSEMTAGFDLPTIPPRR